MPAAAAADAKATPATIRLVSRVPITVRSFALSSSVSAALLALLALALLLLGGIIRSVSGGGGGCGGCASHLIDEGVEILSYRAAIKRMKAFWVDLEIIDT
jgi:Na+-transporting NADH:ubiquinone oxidoreductase subunit NqrF